MRASTKERRLGFRQAAGAAVVAVTVGVRKNNIAEDGTKGDGQNVCVLAVLLLGSLRKEVSMENEKYVLNPYIKCIKCGDDELLIRHGIRSSFSTVLQDKAGKRLLGKVEQYFKTPSSFEDIVEDHHIAEEDKDDLKAMIVTLSEKNILIRGGEDIASVYFDTILNGKTRLTDKKVGFIGTGFLGSRIVTQMLGLGVKEVSFSDNRCVENKELERRFFSIENNMIEEGMSYVNMLISHLSKNGHKNFSGVECDVEDARVKEIFHNSDFVIVNSECYSPKLFHTINRIALEMGRAWMSVYTDGSMAVIGPLYIPGETLCYSEFELQVEATLRHRDEHILYKDYMEEEGIRLPHFVIPPISDIVSSYTAFFAAKFLTTGHTCISERAIFISFEDLSIDYQNVFKLPRCPACGSLKPAYKHSFV